MSHGAEHCKSLWFRQAISKMCFSVQRADDLWERQSLHGLPRARNTEMGLSYAGNTTECEDRVRLIVQPFIARFVYVQDQRVWLDNQVVIHACGFFGGSLWTNSGHRSSINSRIGSEMASMYSNSRTSLCIRSISSDVMILPS